MANRLRRSTRNATKQEPAVDEINKDDTDTQECNVLDKTAQLKYKHDMLAMELYHLQEFVSLATFDPSVNYTDKLNFATFMDQNNISLKHTHEKNSQIREVQKKVQEKYELLHKAIEKDELVYRKHKKQLTSRPKAHIEKKQKSSDSKIKREQQDAEEEEVLEPMVKLSNSPSVSDDFEEDTSSSLSEYELITPVKKRVKLTVSELEPTVTNPMHVTIPKYRNLTEYLDSFKTLDEDVSIEQFEQFVTSQQQIFQNIRRGVQDKVLEISDTAHELKQVTLKDVSLSTSHVEPIKVAYKEQNQFPMQDHLINQGIVLSKMFKNSTKNKIARSKKIAGMIELHFKHAQGAEKRKHKDERKRIRNLAKATAQQVKKRWALAEKAFKVLKKNEQEELKKIQGKKHLSEMLEKSSLLLGQQLNINEDEEEDTQEDSDGTSQSDDDLSDSDDELSSEDEDADRETSDVENLEENDSNLTVEQLREKYKDMDQSSKELEDANDSLDDKDDMSDNDISQSHIELTETEKAMVAEEAAKDKDGLLDEESDSDSDSENSDDDSMSTAHSSSEEMSDERDPRNGEPERHSALSALLGNIEEDDQEEDDKSDYVEAVEEEEEEEEDEEKEVLEKEIQADESEEPVEETVETNEDMATSDPLAVVDVPTPPLLKGTLRIYQKQGLNWMASLYNNNTNGILADEMGLGKTIQTIALLSWLACEKHIWGPHLIVVPTSVLLNWEMEFKRFAPGFKVLSYYGSPQERKQKRKGWNKEDAFHVCITSYQLVVTDQHSFKRKKWQYMILDEAHNIKNFRSTRWQALLNFNTNRRLLLTGTPLQNNITELWSLLYFLMPKTMAQNGSVEGFADLDAFQQWFGNPVDKIIEAGENEQDSDTKKTVDKLHQVLRPYLLRRLKKDVEKQMPGKYEHVVYCKLSKRQRFLYDEFMSRAQTRETLASGNFLSIINCLMQLRKVCNHPDLFEVRPIITSFAIERNVCDEMLYLSSRVQSMMQHRSYEKEVDLKFLKFVSMHEPNRNTYEYEQISKNSVFEKFQNEIEKLRLQNKTNELESYDYQDLAKYYTIKENNRIKELISSLNHANYINSHRCDESFQYGKNLVDLLTVVEPNRRGNKPHNGPVQLSSSSSSFVNFLNILKFEKTNIEKFSFVTPNVVVLQNSEIFCNMGNSLDQDFETKRVLYTQVENPFHTIQTKLSIEFPDKSLLQYDCGKLQKLASLMKDLKAGGHRVLIFTQMTKVLDILEQFLNNNGYLYLRLDGATKIEDRQMLTEKFNSDTRITCFILSSRSGGLGINLTGADTVIFYDSDWNPAMDKQCQDRCHRIGQTRDVHIYRFVSEHTIESNILKKAQQKTQLDNVIIQQGDFTTDYFSKITVNDLLPSAAAAAAAAAGTSDTDESAIANSVTNTLLTAGEKPSNLTKLLAQAEDEDDAKAVSVALQESNLDNEDFKESSNTPGNKLDVATTADGSLHTTTGVSPLYDEYEGTNHVEEYMIRYIANGHYNLD